MINTIITAKVPYVFRLDITSIYLLLSILNKRKRLRKTLGNRNMDHVR